jgi:hypothetical protein
LALRSKETQQKEGQQKSREEDEETKRMMLTDENYEPNLKKSQKGKVSKGKNGTGRTIEEMYQKKSQLEHILLRPDTYGMSVMIIRISHC